MMKDSADKKTGDDATFLQETAIKVTTDTVGDEEANPRNARATRNKENEITTGKP